MERRLDEAEVRHDNLEQYTRKFNPVIHGISESSIGVGGTSTVFILDLWYNFFVLDFSLPPTMESKYSN